jgi:hypothetical protein
MMSDWLDDLLEMMPADPYPEDLAERVQASLAMVRRRSRRIRHILHLALVVVSIVGLWLILPRAEMFLVAVPDLSLGAIEDWLSALVRSPGESLLNILGTVITWISGLASALDIEFVLGLGILTTSALYGVINLLSNGAAQEEVMA